MAEDEKALTYSYAIDLDAAITAAMNHQCQDIKVFESPYADSGFIVTGWNRLMGNPEAWRIDSGLEKG